MRKVHITLNNNFCFVIYTKTSKTFRVTPREVDRVSFSESFICLQFFCNTGCVDVFNHNYQDIAKKT